MKLSFPHLVKISFRIGEKTFGETCQDFAFLLPLGGEWAKESWRGGGGEEFFMMEAAYIQRKGAIAPRFVACKTCLDVVCVCVCDTPEVSPLWAYNR